MTKPKMFEKPSGVRDYLPEAVRKLRKIETNVLACMASWGYEEVITPTVEYYDTVGAASATSDQKLFKLLDKRGTTMVLRSELTAPIARVVTSLLKDHPLPIRLAYHSNVFRTIEEEAGRDAEFFQTGVEFIGDGSAEADAEMVALAASSLQAAGVHSFKIALGHVGFLNGLLKEALPADDAMQHTLKLYLLKRDHVGYNETLQSLQLPPQTRARLEGVLRLHGGIEVCQQARELAPAAEAQAAIDHLYRVIEALRAYEVSDEIMVNLTMVGDFSYYSGLLFEGYAEELGFPVCSGGRYDNLLQQFGRPAPATGFALKTNRILEVVSSQLADEPRRILIVYAPNRHHEAITHAMKLRRKTEEGASVAVEVRQVLDGDDWERPNSVHYDEVIQFR